MPVRYRATLFDNLNGTVRSLSGNHEKIGASQRSEPNEHKASKCTKFQRCVLCTVSTFRRRWTEPWLLMLKRASNSSFLERTPAHGSESRTHVTVSRGRLVVAPAGRRRLQHMRPQAFLFCYRLPAKATKDLQLWNFELRSEQTLFCCHSFLCT